MSDSFTEVTSQGWLSRIGESIKGILFGIVAIPLAVFLLWWNEGRAVTTANSIAEGATAVVNVDSSKVDPANDAKLIHTSGEAKAEQPVTDPIFSTHVPALRLERNVEIYQWNESEKTETNEKVGGSKETTKTYTYEKKWADHVIDSSKFKKPAEHLNTGQLIAENEAINASNVTLGAFQLPDSMVSSLPGSVDYTLTEEDFDSLSEELKSKARLDAGKIYIGKNPSEPQIGDQRVTFEIVKPGIFSIVAAQTGNTFSPYQTKAGNALSYIESGTVSAAEMFKKAESTNTIITWLVRGGGFLVMSFGFMAIMRPLAIIGSVLPFLGNLIGVGSGLISFSLSAVISLTVIAVAWIAVRPVLGISLLVLAVGVLVFARKLAKPKTPATSPSPATAV